MNHKTLLIAAALAGVSLTTTAFAYSSKDPTAPTPRIVPSSVVSLACVPPRYIDETVHVAFRLDQNGRPRNIEVLWVDDARLKKQVVEAFRQWRFDTSAVGKDAAAKRFIQPIRLLPES